MKKNMLVLVLVVLAGTLGAEEAGKVDPVPVDREVGKYPLTVCVISGEKLGDHGKPYVLKHEGREVRLCCKSCLKDFQASPAKHLQKLNAAVLEQQKETYPLKECPVSMEKLGAHGEPVPVVVGNNTLVMLCCKACREDAVKDAGRIEKRIIESRQKL
jgi:hypothetical protein